MISINEYTEKYLKDNGSTGWTASLVIANDNGKIDDVIVEDSKVITIVTIQKYFNFDELDTDQHLVELHKSNGRTWFKNLYNSFQDGEWHELA